MRPVSLGKPAVMNDDKLFKQWMIEALAEIERASYEDTATIFNDLTVSNYTALRTLDGTTGTLADVRNFLCTLVADFQNRGMKRSQ